ncbi:MAG: HAMP domain-containing sensor histidine kinase [Bacteroidota bacterium]
MLSFLSQSTWKWVTGIMAIIIMLVTFVYSNYLADQLAVREQQNRELYLRAQRTIADFSDLQSNEDDITFENEILQGFSLPVIYKDPYKYSGNNWGDRRDTLQTFLKNKFESAIADGQQPVKGTGAAKDIEILIFNGPLYSYIKLFPLVQLILLSLFVALGYFLVDTARRAEQNRVWAGLAKETAHQLGTPISAMMAWMDILKEYNAEKPDQLEVIGELEKDVDRLDLIADRFSKIGSDPELEQTNVYDQLDEIKDYMKRRASRKVTFAFPENADSLKINVNRHLFSWVLENLIRNALDAMDGKGSITATVDSTVEQVKIYIADTGKGIPSGQFKDVFRPGFSTKKRGWGLGLSLAKRIIEDYHKGKIFVKQSRINEGTTFGIYLPRA